jgi:hypothetical protein
VGRRARKRERAAGAPPASGATSEHRVGEDGVLTLRDELSAGTLRKLADLDARPGASA